ncbi:MAG: hypothetical protein ACRECY_16760, partial [Phyllobacterium sp.]
DPTMPAIAGKRSGIASKSFVGPNVAAGISHVGHALHRTYLDIILKSDFRPFSRKIGAKMQKIPVFMARSLRAAMVQAGFRDDCRTCVHGANALTLRHRATLQRWRDLPCIIGSHAYDMAFLSA